MTGPVTVTAVTRTAVLGLGLIGGSIAQALTGRHEVVGFDVSEQVRAQAAGWGLKIANDIESALQQADLVVLAGPVPVNDALLAQVPARCLVTDVGGVKRPVVAAWSALAVPPPLVPGHPMAGSETAGWPAARPDLFTGARWVLCPGPWSSAEQWLDICELVLSLGAVVVPAEPDRHDRAAAAISHAPHVVASALGASMAAGPSAALARSLAAGSFRDLTRITASPPERTAEFCFANRDRTAAALRDVARRLDEAAGALELGDPDAFTALLRDGHEARLRCDAAQAGLVASSLEFRLDDPGWAGPLHALADAGGAALGSSGSRARNASSSRSRGR